MAHPLVEGGAHLFVLPRSDAAPAEEDDMVPALKASRIDPMRVLREE